MPFTPTPEQVAIIDAAIKTENNLLISALAGAAKTSTLVLMAEAMVNQQILCLAFNRKIATEMKERLPHWCTAQTLNSLGHRAWGAFLHRRLRVDASKNYQLIKDWLADQSMTQEELDEWWQEDYPIIRDCIALAKTSGYVPDAYRPATPINPLMGDDEFEAAIPYELDEDQIDCIIKVLVENIKQGLQAVIDYDDQIYLSTIFQACTFPYFPVIMVDEAQDLSSLNHRMLVKLSKNKRSRLIAVGDACQAIYGFRGAHENSMEEMRAEFDMTELHLSISFRCPQEIVREAQWRAPRMRWPEWAVEGSVRSFSTWSTDDLPERAAIICRNNAPIFAMAMKLLKCGRYPEIIGSDSLPKRVQKILTKLGSDDMPIDHVIAAIDVWFEKEKLKRKDHGALQDFRDCLLIFTEGAATLRDCRAAADRIFNSSGPIKMMTGHKSKGLEFPHVFLLDIELVGDKGQERNLKYVMQTRAQETLTYINTGGFVE